MDKNLLYEFSLIEWAGERQKMHRLNAEQFVELKQLEADEQAAMNELVNATSETRATARAHMHDAVARVVDFRANFGLDPEGAVA